jgi:putative flippase GtrA
MKRFIKFAIVGGIGFPINLGLTYVFKESGMHYIGAMILAFLIAITINYFFNHFWTFKDKKDNNGNLIKGLIKYICVSLPLDATSIGIAILLKQYVLKDFYYGYLMALATGIFIIMLIRYTLVKKLVWATKE